MGDVSFKIKTVETGEHPRLGFDQCSVYPDKGKVPAGNKVFFSANIPSTWSFVEYRHEGQKIPDSPVGKTEIQIMNDMKIEAVFRYNNPLLKEIRVSNRYATVNPVVNHTPSSDRLPISGITLPTVDSIESEDEDIIVTAIPIDSNANIYTVDSNGNRTLGIPLTTISSTATGTGAGSVDFEIDNNGNIQRYSVVVNFAHAPSAA